MSLDVTVEHQIAELVAKITMPEKYRSKAALVLESLEQHGREDFLFYGVHLNGSYVIMVADRVKLRWRPLWPRDCVDIVGAAQKLQAQELPRR